MTTSPEDTLSGPEHAQTAEAMFSAAERRLAITQNVLDFAIGIENKTIHSGLLPHQEPAFIATANFLRSQALSIQDEQQLTVSGYLDLPTSFGKTVMMAKLARAAGIGQINPEGQPRRRALVLVPTRSAVQQTIGGTEGGFGQHASELSCTPYFTDAKDLTGDVVVMTYSSFLRFVQRIAKGEIADPQFDLILCDEAHHTLGAETQRALNEYRQGKIAIGLTATPEFNEEETIGHLFEHQIYKSDLLELVKAGVLNGVQLIGLATGHKIRSQGKRWKDFAEKDLRSIRYDDARNKAIVEVTKQLVAEGRRGIINAIVGDDCDHAIKLAGALNGAEIEDTKGGTKVIRAAAIGEFVHPNERQRLLKAYKRGEIDVLTQVKILNESWDEDEVGFIINAAPTASKVVATQRIGRGMRVSGDWPLTVIVEFMDDFTGRKRPVTAWHVFGEEEFTQNKILTTPANEERVARAKKTHTKRTMGRTATTGQGTPPPMPEPESAPRPGDTFTPAFRPPTTESDASPAQSPQPPAAPYRRPIFFDTDTMSDGLKEMGEDFALRVTRELTIRAQEKLEPPKPGWITLQSVWPHVRDKGMGIYALRQAIINEGNMACELAQSPSGPLFFVPPEAEEFARNYQVIDYAPANYYNIADMERTWKVSRSMFDPIIERLESEGKIKHESYRSPTLKRKLKYYSLRDFKLIETEVLAKLENIPKSEDNLTLVADLAAEVGQKRNTVQFFLVRHHSITGMPATSPKTKRDTTAYTETEASIARFHYSHDEMPKDGVPIEQLERRLHMAEEAIIAQAAEKGVGNLLKKGRFADAGGNYHYTLFCEASDAPKIERALRQTAVEPTPPAQAPVLPVDTPETNVEAPTLEGTVDFMALLRELRCNPAAARFLLRQTPFAVRDPIQHPTHGNYLIPTDIAVVLRRRCQEIGPAPKASVSDRQLAAQWKRPLSEIHEIAASITTDSSTVGLFRTTDGSDVITLHYMQRLALPIKHVLTQKYGRPGG